jgi:hypothetical protein
MVAGRTQVEPIAWFWDICCAKSSVTGNVRGLPRNLFDCVGMHVVCSPAGRKGRFAMFETMTALMGLVGAGIFLAHAFEGIRSRA